MNPYNPTRTYLLARFALAREMVRGEKHFLYDRDGRRYLDFLSQYGAVSLGHNHPELLAAVQEALADGQPAMIQPFTSPAAQELAERLAEITPGDLGCTVFTNSGAEAVEAAVKLARSSTGRPVILSTLKGFHGKTLGALSATGNPVYQAPFGAPAPGFEYVPFGDLDALAAKLQSDGNRIAAFLVEPVQGEGGMVPATDGYLAGAVELCRRAGVLSVFDEVQTGLGRTGTLFAAEADGAAPDVMLLGKALGGGLFPIGACVCTPKVWDHTFGMLHSSTFAGNQLACAVALKVIDLLLRDDGAMVRAVAESGEYLLGRLADLAQRHPGVVAGVRGRGLMAGVEFRPYDGDESYAMYFADSNALLTVLYGGYLLSSHRIVTAPVFNDSNVLRLEPPFTVGRAEIDEAVEAIDDLCGAVGRKDYASVFRHLTEVTERPRYEVDYTLAVPRRRARTAATKADGRASFAFLVHYSGEADYLRTDPAFRDFTPVEFKRWQRWVAGVGPGVIDHVPKFGSAGADAEGWLIALPMLPRRLLRMPRADLQALFRRAIAMAKACGAKIVGLGGFTAVVTRGGERVVGEGLPITTGNCLTAAMAVEGIAEAARARGRDLADLHVAVVGATGAIGRLSALLLADRARGITLVGNAAAPDAPRRCRIVAGDVYARLLARVAADGDSPQAPSAPMQAAAAAAIGALVSSQGDPFDDGRALKQWIRHRLPADGGTRALKFADAVQQAFDAAGLDAPLRDSCDLDAGVRDADVILVATNSDEILIHPRHLRRSAIVCDVARPSNVAPDLGERRGDVLVFEGGLVQLPRPIEFGAKLQLLPPRVALGCLAETALLAIEGDYGDHSIGQRLDVAEAEYIRGLAEKHGFRPAVPLGDEPAKAEADS